MRLKHITTAFAALAAIAASPLEARAQGSTEICNTVVDSTGKPVQTSNDTAVLHAGSTSCPPPVTAAAAPVETPAPAAPVAAPVYFAFFDHNAAVVTPAAQEILATVTADAMKANATRVNVIGHTDTSGSAKYNQRLSERRANAIRDALAKRGIAKDSIVARGLGESQPLIATADNVREPSNRRTEIRLD